MASCSMPFRDEEKAYAVPRLDHLEASIYAGVGTVVPD